MQRQEYILNHTDELFQYSQIRNLLKKQKEHWTWFSHDILKLQPKLELLFHFIWVWLFKIVPRNKTVKERGCEKKCE